MSGSTRMLSTLAAISGAAMISVSFGAGAARAADSAVPQLEVPGWVWDMVPTPSTDFEPVPGAKYQPVTFDPKYPHVGNHEAGSKTDRVADVNNPILKPWAAEAIQKTNDRVTKFGRTPFVATSLCWPNGTPGQAVVPTAIQFVQRPNEVYMFYYRDHYTRRVWMNAGHDPNFQPTWFGELTGKYVNGDLVIDTVKIIDHPLSFIDNYRVPHTKDLHVTETIHIGTNAKGGKDFTLTAHIDDPGAFNVPWEGLVHYDYAKENTSELPSCAENNPDYFHLNDNDLPTATKLDF